MRWWRNLNVGWQRVNYILLSFYVVYIFSSLIISYTLYERAKEDRYSCVTNTMYDFSGTGIYPNLRENYDLSECDARLESEIHNILLGFVLSLIMPMIIYFIFISTYQWLKEGFQGREK